MRSLFVYIGEVSFKMPKKSKDKKNKNRDMSHIAAALVPTAMFAAVPRTPPPPSAPPEHEKGLTSALLSSTLIGRLFATPEPPTEEHILSDRVSDTSVDDYDRPEDRYSSIDFRGTSTGEYSYRGQMPLPYENGLHDSYEDDYSGRASPGQYATVDGPDNRPRSASPTGGEPMYAKVRKSRSGGRRSHSEDDVRTSMESTHMSSSMRRYAEEDERSLRQSSRRSTLRSAHRSASPSPHSTLGGSPSPRHSVEVKIDSQILGERVARGTSPMSTGRSDLGHSSSLKLKTLEVKNTQLIEQQQQQLALLQQQQKLQQDLMARLAERSLLATQKPDETLKDTDMGSLLQETQSVTEATMTQQASLIQSMQTRTGVLEMEKRELQELNEQLQAEITSLRRLASIKDIEVGGDGTQTLLMKKQLQDFKDERDTLKSAVHRLTAELSRFQAQYRTPPAGEGDDAPGLSARGPIPSWLINTKYLAPLFLAYDDRVAEKDQIIQDYEEEMDHFREKVEEVIKENTRLHIRLEQTDTAGPISMTEWRQLQEQCRLVLEENQLLMEQLDLQQNKAKDMHKAHVHEVSRLSKKLVQTEAERGELEKRVADVKDDYRDVKLRHDSAVLEGSIRPELEDHLSAIAKLKRTLEDEKNKHQVTEENLLTKISGLEAERKAHNVELADIKQENRQLTAELKLLNKGQRKSLKKVLLLQKALEEVETKEMSTSKYLSSVIKVAERTAHERDSILEVAHKQDRQRKKAITKVMQGNLAAVRMEEKLKMTKLKANEKLGNLNQRMKELDEDFNMKRSEYEREIKHLRLLLREREDMLESQGAEKRCVEDDLETMWQVASADNRRMRDTYRKSVRKLKEHATLDALMSDTEEDKQNLINQYGDDN